MIAIGICPTAEIHICRDCLNGIIEKMSMPLMFGDMGSIRTSGNPIGGTDKYAMYCHHTPFNVVEVLRYGIYNKL